MTWIRFTDQKPRNQERIIALSEDGGVCTLETYCHCIGCQEAFKGYTHWIPYKAPPTREERIIEAAKEVVRHPVALGTALCHAIGKLREALES